MQTWAIALMCFALGALASLVSVAFGAAMTWRMKSGRSPVPNPIESLGGSVHIEVPPEGADEDADRMYVA